MKEIIESNKYIITGGPGFGKTSIINQLENLGYHSVHEISRSIIREQIDKGGDILPWKNLETFSRIVFERRIKQFEEAPNRKTCFFDRGIPDVVAYMVLDELELPSKYTSALEEYSYNTYVFLTPPWQEIFINDGERKENYEQAVKAHNQIEKTYRQLGYNTIEIPKVNVEERAAFILQYVNKNNN